MPGAQNVAQFVIKVNGQLLSAEEMNDLHAVEVDLSLHLPGAATIELYDHELKWVDDAKFSIGKPVEITAISNPASGGNGSTPISEVIFKGVITAIEPCFSNDDSYGIFVIRAYDKLHMLQRANATKTYLNQSDADIAKALLGEAGLGAQVDSTSIVHEHVLRDDQTAYEFLRALAARNGFIVLCDGSTVQFKAPESLNLPEVALEYGTDLLEFRPALSASGQVNEVTVGGWDRKAKRAVSSVSTAASFTPTETGFSGRGYVLAQSGLSSSKLHLVESVQTQAETQAAAKAVLNRMAASDITGEGTAIGHPKITPGCKLNISKIGTRFSGKYFVTRARHRLEPTESYTTDFWIGGMSSGTLSSLLAAAPRGSNATARPIQGLMTAIVTNNNDPDKLGRVKLKYPQLIDTAETSWAPVVSAGAGNNRGMVAIPEVNDEVLVGFEGGDINRPFVLGALWNGQDKPPSPSPVANGKVDFRVFQSRSGHILKFTDKDGSEKIELIDKTGKNILEFDATANHIKLTSAQDITIEAKNNLNLIGMNVKIEGKTKIDAGAPMIQAEGKTQITLKGGMAEFSGTAQAKISAAMVMIN